MVKQSQIVQRYTTDNHIISRKQLEDTHRGFPMHFQRSTPQVDSQMFSTDFPNISFAQNQARARKIHPYAVGFAANTSSGRTVRTLRPLWRSICFSTAVVTCAPSCHSRYSQRSPRHTDESYERELGSVRMKYLENRLKTFGNQPAVWTAGSASGILCAYLPTAFWK